MNADRRATIQLAVAASIAYIIVGLVGYLVSQSTDLGERGQLIGTLSGGFGAAVAFFLGNMQAAQRQRDGGAGPTVHVEGPGPVDVNANAAPLAPPEGRPPAA